jgi:arsenate reductase
VRSQIAEGLLGYIYPDRYEVFSAGLYQTGVNPDAIDVMREIGIDISTNRSKKVSEYIGVKFDYVITMSGEAKANSDLPKSVNHIHKEFEDPARTPGKKQDIINAFRNFRDNLKDWIVEVFE